MLGSIKTNIINIKWTIQIYLTIYSTTLNAVATNGGLSFTNLLYVELWSTFPKYDYHWLSLYSQTISLKPGLYQFLDISKTSFISLSIVTFLSFPYSYTALKNVLLKSLPSKYLGSHLSLSCFSLGNKKNLEAGRKNSVFSLTHQKWVRGKKFKQKLLLLV